ncbi:MAG: coproporphyrinogen III oxidase family protein [Gammaproteobacteria bacterium]|nr:coproporphyrinogen III oxidase family protein [Gammaproteobacteria bacterium]
MRTVETQIAKARAELAAMDIEGVRASGILPASGSKFFPVIGYPPLTMFSDMDQQAIFQNFDSRPARKTIAYIHIPFCPSRCTFCHWITKTKSKSEEVDVYLDYLEKEMILYKTNMGMEKIPAHSVLIGGGTPTYLNVEQTLRFMQMIHRHYDLSVCTQFSVEAEPRTLLGDDGFEKLRIMQDHGVHRISMGVQSFDDDILAYMGRVHTHQDTLDAITQMRRAKIENIFIDLIYAYPNQSVEMWTRNMLQAVELDIEGYQLYRLRVKQHGDRQGNIITQFNKKPDVFPDADTIQLMKHLGIMISEDHGFHEYQTRIFAKKENDISHYLRDWCCGLTDVVGVGVSSWSNLRGVFTLNVGDTSLQTYYDLIDQGKVAINRGKIRTNDDELRRNFILPLKNMKVDKSYYKLLTGITVDEVFGAEIEWLATIGVIEQNNDYVWLSKLGRFFADEVTTQFFNHDYLPFPEVVDAQKQALG